MDFSGSSGHIVHHQKGIPAGTARRPSTSSMGVSRQVDSEQANFRVARDPGGVTKTTGPAAYPMVRLRGQAGEVKYNLLDASDFQYRRISLFPRRPNGQLCNGAHAQASKVSVCSTPAFRSSSMKAIGSTASARKWTPAWTPFPSVTIRAAVASTTPWIQ